jgi:hypothetical protein
LKCLVANYGLSALTRARKSGDWLAAFEELGDVVAGCRKGGLAAVLSSHLTVKRGLKIPNELNDKIPAIDNRSSVPSLCMTASGMAGDSMTKVLCVTCGRRPPKGVAHAKRVADLREARLGEGVS